MIVLSILGWIFTAVLILMLLSMVMLHKWLAVFLLILLILIIMPVTSNMIRTKLKINLFPVIKAVAVILLLFAFSRTIVDRNAVSIYADKATEEKFITMYTEKMKDWPVDYEDIFLETEFGKVHVIKCGDSSLQPLILLHASGVAGWSWKHNAQELSRHYQLFVIDTIGDAGLSSYHDLNKLLKTGRDLADFYTGIFSMLDIETAVIVGASEGGFLGTNIALHHPERVEKLILAGPMGYSGAGKSVMRITLAQLFPLNIFQEGTERWAFGTDKKVRDDFGEWFQLLLSSTAPKKVAPFAFSSEQRQSLSVPVMFIFGERDNLVGNTEAAVALVQDIPDVRVKIVDTGHLVAAEKPEMVNRMIIDYLEN